MSTTTVHYAATKARQLLGTQPIYITLYDRYDNNDVQIGQPIRCTAKISDDPGGTGLQVYKTGSWFLHIFPDYGESGIVWNRPTKSIKEEEDLNYTLKRADGSLISSGRMPITNTDALTPSSTITPMLRIPIEF